MSNADLYQRVPCILCPEQANGEPYWHHWGQAAKRTHILLSNIIRAGLLQSRWFLLTKRQKAMLVAAAERDGLDMSGFRDWVARDEASRAEALNWLMGKGGTAPISDLLTALQRVLNPLPLTEDPS